MLARRLSITGKVQGVGFRDALCDEARRLGLLGWVRNRGDGSVEAFVQGAPAAVRTLTEWAARGPRLARVSGVRAEDQPTQTPPPTGFERLPSA